MPNSDDMIKQLENAESVELDDESLEDAAGGNGNCNNTSCCQPEIAVDSNS